MDEERQTILGAILGVLPRLLLWLGLAAAALAGVGLIVATVFYFAITPRKFDLAEIERANRIPGITFYDSNDQWLAAPRAQHGEQLKLKDMPAYLPQAFIAIEDRRFYKHWGIDVRGVLRALWANFRAGRTVQGGSTITQQLARNLFLSTDKTVSRKLKEALYAVWLERHLAKDEILELYLNRIYFGAGTYGVDAASRLYFNKPAKKCPPPRRTAESKECRDLSIAEAAMLAGLPKAPTKLAPNANLQSAKDRAGFVLRAMAQVGFLSPAQETAANETLAALQPADLRLGIQYYLDYVYALLAEIVPQGTDDLIVYTTLDSDLQRQAEDTVKAFFCDPKAEESAGENGATPDQNAAKKCKESQATESALRKVGQAALVSIDADGALRAMVGGKSYLDSQFNRATQAQRQPGSAFKPFVYVAALEHGYTPDTIVDDAPIDPPIDTPQGPWSPTNYTEDFRGPVTVREALTHSLNTVAVRLSEAVGPKIVAETAGRLGVASKLQGDHAIALGAEEVNLLELTCAFLPFARTGLRVPLHTIRKVTTKSGEVLFEYSTELNDKPKCRGLEQREPERVMDEGIATTMTSMMYGVIAYGTGRNAGLGEGRPAAGKTGTSSDWRDAWFVGYTAQLITGVWVGNDDNSQMDRVTGGGLPARIWKDFMQAAHAHKPIAQLPGGYPYYGRKAAADLKSFYVELAGEMAQVAGSTAPPTEQPASPPPKKRRWPW